MKTLSERPSGPAWRAVRRALAPALVLAAISVAALVVGGTGASAQPTPLEERPNVVVVMSDDETVQALQFQKHVLGQIADKGATFTNNFVNFPLCCPSRSTFLTGLYATNHHVEDNAPPLGGFDRFERLDSNNDLPLWLQRTGYHTGQVGKYLNGYGNSNPTLVPPGWDEWYAIAGRIAYYNYTLNVNGTDVSYGESPSDYVDDVITGRADEFISRVGPGSAPFFLYVAYKAPHGGGPHPTGDRCSGGPPEPPPRHFGQFANEPLPKPPNFNEADVSDKPRFVQNSPLLTPARIAKEQELYQCELESLQGVDDGVNSIVRSLRAIGELKNTLLIYTSDNGFFHGEHRIYTGKTKVYEPSVRVPLVMRGPGIPEGVKVRDLTINADLAPTIVRETGARADRIMNGRPILSDARHPTRELGRELLLQGNDYFGVRTARYKYVLYNDGEQEMYDEKLDPYELQNVVNDPQYEPVESLLASELATLRNCRRGNCHRLPKLDIELHYSRAESQFGGPCSKGPVAVAFERADSALLVEARFAVLGNTTDVTTAPFQLVIPQAELPLKNHARLDVTADLLDGREMTLDAKLPSRCA